MPRAALVELLSAAAGGDLVLVTAPAGFGKTTVVAQWDDADPRPFVWVRLDFLDDDPAHLLLHIAGAVEQVVGLDPAVLRYLCGPGRDPLTHLVPEFVAALEQTRPFVLVLDDAHEVSAEPVLAALAALLDMLPGTVTAALLARSACARRVGRRRLRGGVLEIGVAQLRLSDVEARQVFEAAGGAGEEQVRDRVLARCEGWVAAVVLAALASGDGLAETTMLTGCHPLVSDYLVEEVLDQLDTETGRFLHESAVLGRFCAAALDQVLDRGDSGERLESLGRSGNWFLSPLDEHGLWYRYHPLLGDLLVTRLRSADSARFHEIARRAADYFERHGDVDAAMVQALAAGDDRHAAALVGRHAPQLGFDGRGGLLARRLALLDDATVAVQPDAAMASAWLGVITGDADLIQRSLLRASRADRGLPLADGSASVKVGAALVSSLVGIGGVHDVVRHADTVREAGDNLVNPWWGAATVMKGAAEAMIGNTRSARLMFESALPVVGDLPGFRAAALAHLAMLDLGDGDDQGAFERSAMARRLADDHDLCDVVPMIVVYGVSAVTAAYRGDTRRAREAMAVTEKLLSGLGSLAARTALLGHGLLAWTAAVVGDPDTASRHLQAGDRAARREPEAKALILRLERVRQLISGADHVPLTAAELRLLPFLATHFSLQRIAEELVIGRETVKSQARSIYRKFGVPTRAAAVAEARRLGLLRDPM